MGSSEMRKESTESTPKAADSVLEEGTSTESQQPVHTNSGGTVSESSMP